MSEPVFESHEEEAIYKAIKAMEAHWAKFKSYDCLHCKANRWGPIHTKTFGVGCSYMEAECGRCGFKQKVHIERPMRLAREGEL